MDEVWSLVLCVLTCKQVLCMPFSDIINLFLIFKSVPITNGKKKRKHKLFDDFELMLLQKLKCKTLLFTTFSHKKLKKVFFLEIKPSASIWVQAPKTRFFTSFFLFFLFTFLISSFYLFHVKNVKKYILIITQYPNAGQNIQHP